MKKQLLHALLVLTLVGSSAIASSDTAKKDTSATKKSKTSLVKKDKGAKTKDKDGKKGKDGKGKGKKRSPNQKPVAQKKGVYSRNNKKTKTAGSTNSASK